jgi:hypothetical protein
MQCGFREESRQSAELKKIGINRYAPSAPMPDPISAI